MESNSGLGGRWDVPPFRLSGSFASECPRPLVRSE